MSGGYSQRGTSLELQELLEERLRRPMGSPMQNPLWQRGVARAGRHRELPFAVDAELIVYGVSHPHAHVTLQGEPVPLRPDGSFMVRMRLPDRRQVIPVIASSARRRRAADDHPGCRAEYEGARPRASRSGRLAASGIWLRRAGRIPPFPPSSDFEYHSPGLAGRIVLSRLGQIPAFAQGSNRVFRHRSNSSRLAVSAG